METGHRLHIRPEHRDRFSRLAEAFGIIYAVGIDGVPKLPALRVDHKEPQTAVGGIRRPLIFPHAIVNRCRTMWDARNVRFSFAGLVTESRRQVLGNWLNGVDTRAQLAFNDASASGIRWLADVPRRLLARWRKKSLAIGTGELVFWSSQRGRHFPIKSWDEEYYRLLSRSQFVLCPRGDHVWTYRFFEAALCGAMPVVEDACEAYAGFRYRTMTEPASAMEWRGEDAEHNYERCRERLTVPGKLLKEEVAALLLHGAR
jgi:hypothetical protein